MNRSEWRTTGALSSIYALRMFGMFMVLPVLSLYARHLTPGVSGLEIGLAVGIYGLLQALLQVPLGVVSDRIGRKPVITIGLIVFAAGSVLAGWASSIAWLIAGRALQGAGAISSAASALLADATRPQVRTQAMTILGAGMGASFLLALIAGPPLSGVIGVDGIFVLTGALAALALPVLWRGVPNPPRLPATPGAFRRAVSDPQLLRLDAGIFLLHTMMTALFVAAPFVLQQTLGLPGHRQWEVYLPVLVASIVPVFALIRRIEAAGRIRAAFIAAVLLLGLALAGAGLLHGSGDGFTIALFMFFVAFNYLEGTLPSLISRRAPASGKGAALGVYSTCQFLGGFAGGVLGGTLLTDFGAAGVFYAAGALALPWLLIAAGLKPPPLMPHPANDETSAEAARGV
ncbi:MAG: MFS transporter [Gammaproteobacteria bacterium]|nr:MFS transporter [Gammaproteobacteria bacterium]